VTPQGGRQLRQFDAAGGDELRRVDLPKNMLPRHAVESPIATFIVGHRNTQLAQYQVSEVSTEGQVLREFSGSLGVPQHIAVDRQGNIFVAIVADSDKHPATGRSASATSRHHRRTSAEQQAAVPSLLHGPVRTTAGLQAHWRLS